MCIHTVERADIDDAPQRWSRIIGKTAFIAQKADMQPDPEAEVEVIILAVFQTDDLQSRKGVIYQDINVAKARLREINHPLDLILDADISRDKVRTRAIPAGYFLHYSVACAL
jgi:hypothetical protein